MAIVCTGGGCLQNGKGTPNRWWFQQHKSGPTWPQPASVRAVLLEERDEKARSRVLVSTGLQASRISSRLRDILRLFRSSFSSKSGLRKIAIDTGHWNLIRFAGKRSRTCSMEK